MTETNTQHRETWFLATCLDCTPRLPMPFTTEQERNGWAKVHTNHTGHRVEASVEAR